MPPLTNMPPTKGGLFGMEAQQPGRPQQDRLSADAPVFVPQQSQPKPHVVSVLHSFTMATGALKCDLMSLTVEDIRLFVEMQFSVTPNYTLLFNGQPLTNNPSAKAIDIGLGNGSVLVVYEPQLLASQIQGSSSGSSTHPTRGSHNQRGQPQQQAMQQMLHSMSMMGGSPPPARNGSSSGAHTPNASSSLLNFTPSKAASSGFDSSPDITPEKLTPANQHHHADPYNNNGSSHNQFMGRIGEETYVQVINDFVELARDAQVGSKMVLAVLDTAPPEHLVLLLQKAHDSICELASSMPGSEVLIALLTVLGDAPETFSERGYPIIIEAMVPHCVELCNHGPGRKFVQHLVGKYRDEHKLPFYDACCRELVNIAVDQCGCITLQRMYDNCQSPQLKERMCYAVCCHAQYLICDPYANYVIQLLVKDSKVMSEKIVNILCNRIKHCATDKFGSNVIEKCLMMGSEKARNELIMTLCSTDVIEVLVKDAFGNYVIQTAIEHSPTHLVELLRSNLLPFVESSPYSYRIEAKLTRRLKKGPTPHGCNHP
eukprot:TRINITY_DN2352_c0_g2_i1.p1 TRINITY_DN2352_c0_g2~~TRINITY_DN2352_c0_g2_i1.p1  ORF type:complete len:633 (+),score=264.21 TRINITY_DN2352_c0_g2_i1:271-1899(+)